MQRISADIGSLKDYADRHISLALAAASEAGVVGIFPVEEIGVSPGSRLALLLLAL